MNAINSNQNANLWSKNFVIVSVINFLLMTIYYMLLVTIGNYVVETFHVSPSLAGLVVGIMILGSLVGRFVTGYLIELIGCRIVLLGGVIIFIVSTLSYFVALNIGVLCLVRFINGISIGVVGTVTGTIVCYIVSPNRRGEAISYFSLSTILSAAIGPFIGLLLILYIPFSSLLVLGVASGIVSLIIALIANVKVTLPASDPNQKKSWFQLSNYIEVKSVGISFITLIAAFGYSAIQAYVAFFAKEINVFEVAGFFFVVYAIAVLVSRPFTGKIFDLKGENIIIYPSLILLIIGLIVFSQTHSAFAFLFSGALIGLGFGNFQSIAQAVAVRMAPPHKAGQATSTFFIFLDLGIGFAPYLLGKLIPYVGYSGLYLVTAATTTISLILYYFLHGRHHYVIEIVDDNRKEEIQID